MDADVVAVDAAGVIVVAVTGYCFLKFDLNCVDKNYLCYR